MGKNLLCYNAPVSRCYVSVLTILLRISVSAPVDTATEQLLHLRLRTLKKKKKGSRNVGESGVQDICSDVSKK